MNLTLRLNLFKYGQMLIHIQNINSNRTRNFYTYRLNSYLKLNPFPIESYYLLAMNFYLINLIEIANFSFDKKYVKKI